MYDSICKFIAREYSQDIATWLLGKKLNLTELQPSELSHEPIRADTVILLQSPDLILHLEFQTQPQGEIPYRMLDYATRLYRVYPNQQLEQVVIYLKKSQSSLVRQNQFTTNQTQHLFRVIRLGEIPSDTFLNTPGLLPFAVLSQTDNPEKTLLQVAQSIETITDKNQKSNLAASSSILAGLLLEKETIKKILKEEIMKESVIYQDILAKGLQQGRQEGLQQEINLILRQLQRRIGEIAPELITQINNLSLNQLENLGEALLDFQTSNDLIQWLNSHSN